MRFSLLFSMLFLLPATGRAVVIDQIAAIVNEDIITQSELTAMEQLELRLSGLPSSGNILQSRIDQHLVMQQMKRQPPVELSEDTIKTAIESYVKKHGGTEELLLFLHTIGMNYREFENEVRDQLTVSRFVSDRFRPFVNITIEDAENYYADVFKPELLAQDREILPFPEAFNEIQERLVRERVQDRIAQWLVELRRSASIYIKD